MVLKLQLGNVLRLKKSHPCGNYLWEVVRLGADIGLRCTRCDRRIMIDRANLDRRVKEVIAAPAPGQEARSADES